MDSCFASFEIWKSSVSSFARQVLCLWRERGTSQSIEFQWGASDLDCTFSFLNEREKKKSLGVQSALWCWFSPLLQRNFEFGL